MTQRKVDNSLYTHLKSVINQALPLEYAIRAARETNLHELEQLSEIDLRIRQHWIALGASEAEIDAESLMDVAWDMIQIGFPLMRRHGRLYPTREFDELIGRGMHDMQKIFRADARQFIIPASRYFRVCDLLRGNDILGLLKTVASCLRDARSIDAPSEIELERFVRGIREPIHLHPGIDYVLRARRKGERTVTCFGIDLDPEIEFSIPDLKRQIREFLYQYAAFRQSGRPRDRNASELLNELLDDEMFGRAANHQVSRLDGYMSILSGLYCWDLVQRYRQEGRKSFLGDAIAHTQEIYPKSSREVDDQAIRKNYYTVREAIKKVPFAP
ncbi:hypothetical protein [Cupriavidus oxalaticus]|uniref:Uncharacterized protein n=1 Tax=Cupriavidus oxalaticus TaxID=96344 RepID=A0A4P7LNZ1_9BURK|nr:hypothetical protein [Cupriavidus oxalaticus]QBY54467.1 hypothetical protein E0W60_26110 [Cupriavidus oxalaticus]